MQKKELSIIMYIAKKILVTTLFLCSCRVAADKYPNNRMLGWRPLKDGVVRSHK